MMTWDELILEVNRTHLALVEELRAAEPRIWHRSEAWGNDVFPLSASLTLNLTGPHRDEDIVLAARFALDGSTLDFACDISREDGQIVLDGPYSSRSSADRDETQRSWAASQVAGYRDFVNGALPLVRVELGKLRT